MVCWNQNLTGFTTKRTRTLLQKLGLSKVHDDALYEDYYDYLETYFNNKVDILPLKRYIMAKFYNTLKIQ